MEHVTALLDGEMDNGFGGRMNEPGTPVDSSTRERRHRRFWLGCIVVLLAGQSPPGRGFWREVAVGLGFAGLSMMGLQFFLTERAQLCPIPSTREGLSG